MGDGKSSKLVKGLVYTLKGIDKISELVGKVGGYATVSLSVALMSFEVIMRYGFNRPTRFSLESCLILQVLIVATTAAYILKEEGHVSMDFVTERLSPVTRNWLTCITSFFGLFYCAFLCVLLWKTAMWNATIGMVTEDMEIPVAPIQFALFGGLALLGLQFIARSYKYYTLAVAAAKTNDAAKRMDSSGGRKNAKRNHSIVKSHS